MYIFVSDLKEAVLLRAVRHILIQTAQQIDVS